MKHPTPPPSIETSTTVPDQPSKQSMGLTFNWEDWVPFLEDADIPDTQKREMIETLWQIVIAFVDLGFELNPHQQAHGDQHQQNCGQSLDLKAVLQDAVLKSEMAERAISPPNKPKHKEPTL